MVNHSFFRHKTHIYLLSLFLLLNTHVPLSTVLIFAIIPYILLPNILKLATAILTQISPILILVLILICHCQPFFFQQQILGYYLGFAAFPTILLHNTVQYSVLYLTPAGVTYIDENVGTDSSAFYLGVFYTMAILGPALGYSIGGQFLNIHTDFLRLDFSLRRRVSSYICRYENQVPCPK
jgi:hypothetical protein